MEREYLMGYHEDNGKMITIFDYYAYHFPSPIPIWCCIEWIASFINFPTLSYEDYSYWITILSLFRNSCESYKKSEPIIPIGTVLPFYQRAVPENFLLCDGIIYNKADYPTFVNYLENLQDANWYIVEEDDTKFKVPDLEEKCIVSIKDIYENIEERTYIFLHDKKECLEFIENKMQPYKDMDTVLARFYNAVYTYLYRMCKEN